jgi:excinuclease ABC subunit A
MKYLDNFLPNNGSKKIKSKDKGYIEVNVKQINNLKNLSVKIPLHQLVVVSGVSGAGKSSLIHHGLLEPLQEKIFEQGKVSVANIKNRNSDVYSTEEISRVIVVDQSPIGRNSRSTPASYLKVWDHIRTVFASTVEARTRGWGASYFSYNAGDGKCPNCKGSGQIELEMSFLSEARVICEQCRGKRFNDEALSIRYLGHTVADVLALTFEEARDLFTQHKKIHRLLHTACDLGLGYLSLGQSSNTLSGGECQRIKLVTELARPTNQSTLYILDEPTVGLHRTDVAKLLKVLRSLVALNNYVIA